jgi:hypothetical protein
MRTAKEEALELIHGLPDDCTSEDIQYHLYVRDKVIRGIRAVDEGRVMSLDEAERRVKEWHASSGPIQP